MYLTKSNFTFSCLAPLKRLGRTMKKLMFRYLAFIAYFNATMAKPFQWTYGRKPLSV